MRSLSALLIALQCGLLLGLFSITSIPIDESRADIWVGHPEVPSVDLGSPIPEAWQSYLAMPEVERTEPYMEGFAYWNKPTGGMELVLVIGTRLGPDSIGAVKQLTPIASHALSEPSSVVIDEGEFARLGINKVGDTAEIFGKRMRVVGRCRACAAWRGPIFSARSRRPARFLRPPPDQCTFILAKCYRKEDAPIVVAELNKAYPRKLFASTTADFSSTARCTG